MLVATECVPAKDRIAKTIPAEGKVSRSRVPVIDSTSQGPMLYKRIIRCGVWPLAQAPWTEHRGAPV